MEEGCKVKPLSRWSHAKGTRASSRLQPNPKLYWLLGTWISEQRVRIMQNAQIWVVSEILHARLQGISTPTALRLQHRLKSIQPRAGSRNRIRDSDAGGGADKRDSKSRGERDASGDETYQRELISPASGRRQGKTCMADGGDATGKSSWPKFAVCKLAIPDLNPAPSP